jgi:hypothetical protein
LSATVEQLARLTYQLINLPVSPDSDQLEEWDFVLGTFQRDIAADDDAPVPEWLKSLKSLDDWKKQCGIQAQAKGKGDSKALRTKFVDSELEDLRAYLSVPQPIHQIGRMRIVIVPDALKDRWAKACHDVTEAYGNCLSELEIAVKRQQSMQANWRARGGVPGFGGADKGLGDPKLTELYKKQDRVRVGLKSQMDRLVAAAPSEARLRELEELTNLLRELSDSLLYLADPNDAVL